MISWVQTNSPRPPVQPFSPSMASAPERTEEERRQIKIDIESGKIPPFEMPDDHPGQSQ